MGLKQIPFAVMDSGTVLPEALPDGRYAQITYSNRPVGLYRLANPFPWQTVSFVFTGGVADTLGGGSDPGHEIEKHEVTKVFLVGIRETQRQELDKMLEASGYVLVPA